ncbi:unnamed protein product [Amaranthus hypochondriacus]
MEKQMNSPLSTTVAADEFDDEEKKMDKFYELIRRFKEAREDHQRTILRLRFHNHNQRRNHTDNSNFTANNKINNSDYNQEIKIQDNEIQGNAIWTPSFKWEDFRGIKHNQEEDNRNRNRNQVVFSDNSGINLLHNSSNRVDYTMDNENNNSISKKIDKNNNRFKKRKINDVYYDDEDDDDDDEITTADRFKNPRPQPFDTGLDLNLAL